MTTHSPKRSLPLDYFLLVFALAVPIWVLGGDRLPLPVKLPASAFTTFVPAIAAGIATYRRSRWTGVKALLKRIGDFKRIRNRIWYAPALLLAPGLYGLSYVVMRSAGLPLPQPVSVPFLMAPVYFVVFFITDAGEELGWSGYATDPLANRWGVPKAGLFLGIVWALWHLVPFIQTGSPAPWILAQSIKTVAMRMLIVWLYSGSGKSVFAATLYHTTDNVSWALFPNDSSHYNPFVTGAITCIAAAILYLLRLPPWHSGLRNRSRSHVM
ncbi:MAG: CPBP family intramembrane glutamic endopeptidase [Nitrososphaerales archaeon]